MDRVGIFDWSYAETRTKHIFLVDKAYGYCLSDCDFDWRKSVRTAKDVRMYGPKELTRWTE